MDLKIEADDSYGQTYGADCSLGYSVHGIIAKKIDNMGTATER